MRRAARQVARKLVMLVPGLRAPLLALYSFVFGSRTSPGREGALGDLWGALGRPQRAIPHYEAAIRGARMAKRPAVVKRLRRWQFDLERSHVRAGRARVEDPLFEVRLRRCRDGVVHTGRLAGAYDVEVNHEGIFVKGYLYASAADETVSLWIDGTCVRRTQVGADAAAGEFTIPLRRDTVNRLPARPVLEVRSGSGRELGLRGRRGGAQLAVPQGDGTLPGAIASGRRVDKKGFIAPTRPELEARQHQYLDLYDRVRDTLQAELGSDLFVLYGTLLGCIRGGDFIPGDDDFDAGYVSSAHDPTEVKQETLEVMRILLRAGFDVSVNRRGRPFRVHDRDEHNTGLHLDARPLWFREGNLWVHKHFRTPGSVEDFLPTAEGVLRGHPVRVPRDPERFLAAYYGSGWRTPDPSFANNPADVPIDIRRELVRAQLSPREVRDFAAEIDGLRPSNPRMGRFIPLALVDLYPLPPRLR